MFAVIDPNWDEPVVLTTTIRETEQEAVDAALLSEERCCNMYSGARFMCTPVVKGRWDLMQSYGYKVMPVSVVIGGSA